MDTIIKTLGAVARLAPTADREALVSLDAKRGLLDAAAKAAISLGTLDDDALIATGEAHVAAQQAIQARFAAIEADQLTLIQSLPTDRRSRRTLRPMATPAELDAHLRHIDSATTSLIRDHGMPLRLLRDGVLVGRVEAHEITTLAGRLIIGRYGQGRLGDWALADIAAVSIEDEDFGILLSDGTLLEIQEDPDFVWTDPAAAVA